MAIISRIGSKHPKVRALHSAIFMVLIAGAITMVYPFLIMLSGSTKSAVDINDMDIIPEFLSDDTTLYRKHIEGLFNESVTAMRETYGTDTSRFKTLTPPTDTRDAFVNEWLNFIDNTEFSPNAFSCGYVDARVSKTIPHCQRQFKETVHDRFDGDITRANIALNTHFASWNWYFDSSAGDNALLLVKDCLPRYMNPADTVFARSFNDFKQTQPAGNRYYLNVEGFYKSRFLKSQYTKYITKYNTAHNTTHKSYNDITLPRSVSNITHSDKSQELKDWETFARRILNTQWIRIDNSASTQYQNFLKEKHDNIKNLNRNYNTNHKSFDDLHLPENSVYIGTARSDIEAFISGWTNPDNNKIHIAPLHSLTINSTEFMFREQLKNKYKTIEALNNSLSTAFTSFDKILPPQKEAHYKYFLNNRTNLKKEFITRNYRTVMNYLVFKGRGVFNTTIYCALAVIFALIVNPMAAYAMSRYKIPSTYKILLFLMLTMAFPPMVTQIPVFIMLRELGLLNTFAALVLPGLANGYAIFLLKGFFDSLPRELYESAEMDGANEWVMFWHITMTLSKPILAVIALQAFTIAYGNFMFALLICQDEKMWTIMVWLYQLHQRSGQAVMYASLIIAAVPTFMIFVFCQKIIMRGIVIPSEK